MDGLRHPRVAARETGLAVEADRAGRRSSAIPGIASPSLTARSRVPVNVCFPRPIRSAASLAQPTPNPPGLPGSGRKTLDGYDIHPAILRRISHALHGNRSSRRLSCRPVSRCADAPPVTDRRGVVLVGGGGPCFVVTPQ